MQLRERRRDWLFIVAFCVFAFTSLAVEPYVVFGWDIEGPTDPIGRGWSWYATTIDPMFLSTPSAVRVMFGIDAFVFGPFYLLLVYAFATGQNWIRLPALLYAGAMLYSMVVDLVLQLGGHDPRARLGPILLIRLPYVLLPILLTVRVWRPEPFARSR